MVEKEYRLICPSSEVRGISRVEQHRFVEFLPPISVIVDVEEATPQRPCNEGF